jgi:hypothetical protein
MNQKNILMWSNRVLLLIALSIILLIAWWLATVGFGFHPLLAWMVFFFLIFPSLAWLAWSVDKGGRKKRIAGNLVILSLLVYVIATGGIAVEYHGGFRYDYQYGIFEGDGIESSLEIAEPDSLFAVPLICWIWYPKSPPHAISISVTDKTQSIKSIHIETAFVDYGEGDKRRYDVNWNREFEAFVAYYQENREFVATPVTSLHANLARIVEENRSFNIELEGFFIKSAGEKVPFKTSTSIEYEEPEYRVGTLLSGL